MRTEPSGHQRHWEGLLEFPVLSAPLNCGQHLHSILQGILAKHHQTFGCLAVGSESANDELGMPLDVAVGPLDHLLLELEELRQFIARGHRMPGMPTTSGLLVAV